MYHTEKNPLKRLGRESEHVPIPRGARQRRLHKAFLRYHDADNWPMLRRALTQMGRTDVMGQGQDKLVPGFGYEDSSGRQGRYQTFKTQHTGLPVMPGGRDVSHHGQGHSERRGRTGKGTRSSTRNKPNSRLRH